MKLHSSRLADLEVSAQSRLAKAERDAARARTAAFATMTRDERETALAQRTLEFLHEQPNSWQAARLREILLIDNELHEKETPQ